MDPPYSETAGYDVDFGLDQYGKMARILRGLKGKAIISLNDHPDIRRIFADFQTEAVPIQYNLAGGGKAVDRQELIIYSWDRTSEPAGLF
jgi:DNA adenine methylase